jgi:hypothetical protein
MKIIVSKKFPKSCRDTLRAAVRASFAYAPADIDVIYVNPIKKRDRGLTDGDATLDGRNAKVTINHRVDSDEMLDTLFHECFHIHQMARGWLVSDFGGFYWHGFWIPTFFYNLFYKVIPFERDAVKFAAKMVRKVQAIE